MLAMSVALRVRMRVRMRVRIFLIGYIEIPDGYGYGIQTLTNLFVG